jgi:hypothetical protein
MRSTIDFSNGATEEGLIDLSAALAGQQAYVKAQPPGMFACEIEGVEYFIIQSTLDYRWNWSQGSGNATRYGAGYDTAAEAQQAAINDATPCATCGDHHDDAVPLTCQTGEGV